MKPGHGDAGPSGDAGPAGDARPAGDAGPAPRWGRRIAWLLGIWILSVGAMALLAFAIKGIMRLAGFAI